MTIATIQFHGDAGGIRSGPLPSAAVDGAGHVWVVWEDCRFRTTCSTNDLVYSTSADGVTWSAVTRIPIDDVSSTVDHFIPGIGIDPATFGAAAHVALHYYYYPQSNCTVSTCQLFVGYISSANGGRPGTLRSALTGCDAAELAAEFAERIDGRRLHRDCVHATACRTEYSRWRRRMPGSTFNEAMYTAQGLTAATAGRQLSSARDSASASTCRTRSKKKCRRRA